MDQHDFLNALENLTGKIAIVTGGSQGIGLQTTILLARLGATVYICSLESDKDLEGVVFAQEEIKRHSLPNSGSVHFHQLDLSSIRTARKSAVDLKKKTDEAGKPLGRLDIIVGNAGTAFPPLNELSPDGYERTFAVNCLGHFAFVMELLDLVEQTANLYGEARITLTSSYGYKAAKKLDYKALTTRIPDDGSSLLHLGGGMQRYFDSKLAVLYFAMELDRRLRARSVHNVFVNACHPGNVPRTEIGNGQQPLVNPWLEKAIKYFLALFLRNSAVDAAKTQVFLSAAAAVKEDNVHGQFWAATWSWWQTYTGTQREDLTTTLARDEDEWKRLWDFCEAAVVKFHEQISQ